MKTLTLDMILGKIIKGNALKVLKMIPENSVDIIVTSPPYNAGMEYEKTLSDQNYIKFITEILRLLLRVAKPDGRICWNVSGTVFRGRDKSDFFDLFGSTVLARQNSGWKHREYIVWDQIHSGSQTAWGSWKSASSPFIRHKCEFILIGYKEYWKKLGKGISTIQEDEFMRNTIDKWRFTPQTSNRTHPAPFPPEFVYRCLQTFSYKDDIILDPFVGSGTTAEVCIANNRHFIGIEKEPAYIKIAQKRIKKAKWKKQQLDKRKLF